MARGSAEEVPNPYCRDDGPGSSGVRILSEECLPRALITNPRMI